MLVRELYTHDATSVREDTDLDTALDLLARLRISALPVVGADDLVVGILSEADVLRLHLAADPRAHVRPQPSSGASSWPRTVGEVMSAEPVVARQGDDVSRVARVLADTGWKSLPVVDDQRRLVGMVSRSDVIRALSTDDDTIRRRVERDLSDLELGAWEVSVVRAVVTLRGEKSAREARAAADVAATSPGVRKVVVEPSGPAPGDR